MASLNSIVSGKHGPLVGAIDQGTSSSRFLVFASKTSELIAYHQMEIDHILPHDGWVEEDPFEILKSVYECIEKTVEKLKALEIDPRDIKGNSVPFNSLNLFGRCITLYCLDYT